MMRHIKFDWLLAIVEREGDPMPDVSVSTPDTVWIAQLMRVNTRLIHTNQCYHFIAGGMTQDDADAISQAVFETWRDYMLPLLTVHLDYFGTSWVSLDQDNFLAGGSGNTLRHGAYAGDYMPNNVAFRVELATALVGRNYRGHNTISGLPRNMVTEHTVDLVWAASVLTAYQRLIDIGPPLGWEFVVVSNELGGVNRVVGITTPITSAYVKDYTVDSMRRRIPGRRH